MVAVQLSAHNQGVSVYAKATEEDGKILSYFLGVGILIIAILVSKTIQNQLIESKR